MINKILLISVVFLIFFIPIFLVLKVYYPKIKKLLFDVDENTLKEFNDEKERIVKGAEKIIEKASENERQANEILKELKK